MKAISDYLGLVASHGSRNRGDDYVFSLLSSMACYCGVAVEMGWCWRPFQEAYNSFDPTIAQVMDCLCYAFGLYPERPRLHLAAEQVDIAAALEALHLEMGTPFSVTDFTRQSPLGDLFSVEVSTREFWPSSSLTGYEIYLPPGLFDRCGVGTLRGLYYFICMTTMTRQLPDDTEECALHVLMYILANPTGRFERLKSTIDLWAQSDAGRSYESWILSTFSTTISVDMIARRVFVLISIESFSVEDEDEDEGDLEDPPEPLADLHLFIRGIKVHDRPFLLRTLFNAIRDYMLIMEKEGHWWKEMLDALETYAPRKSHWSTTEGGFVSFLEKVDKHGMTPEAAFWATREQMLQVVTKFYQQTDPYNGPFGEG
jgi:hypothetical protein